jgi:predicted DNA-binding transcriptional regulator YafY
MSDVADLVNLVAFLSANPGIPIRQAADATGRSVKQMLKDLNRILMVGLPPYDPGSYIQFRLDGPEQEVRLQLSEHFARPLTFTAAETVALKYALEHFTPAADEATAGTVAELSNTLVEALHGRTQELLTQATPGFVTPRRTERVRKMIADLTDACEARKVVELEYYSAHRARLAVRRVHPFELVEVGAHFYLFAWCELAQDTRHFRIDRTRSVKVLDKASTRSAPQRRKAGRLAGMFEGRPKDRLKVRFSKELAEEISDEWKDSPGTKIAPGKGGAVVLDTPLYNQFWAIGYLMNFGKHAEIIEPRWLRVELAQTLRKSLEAHKQEN